MPAGNRNAWSSVSINVRAFGFITAGKISISNNDPEPNFPQIVIFKDANTKIHLVPITKI